MFMGTAYPANGHVQGEIRLDQQGKKQMFGLQYSSGYDSGYTRRGRGSWFEFISAFQPVDEATTVNTGTEDEGKTMGEKGIGID